MSKRYWNSAGERNLLKSLGICSYLALVHSKKKARHYISDSEDEPSEDDEENPIRNKAGVTVNLLLIAGTLLQHAEVHTR